MEGEKNTRMEAYTPQWLFNLIIFDSLVLAGKELCDQNVIYKESEL